MPRAPRSPKRPGSLSSEQRTTRVACYLRVSSEDQAEAGTVGTQRHFFENWLRTYSTNQLVDWYVDDGISGTVPIVDRPDGRRLMQDAELGRFDMVLVYKLDRLGRTLRNLLDAHDELEAHGVAIKSANEPFDTSTDLGRLVFQLLGSLAEFERNTIVRRTTDGKNRATSEGRYIGGVVPLGYDLTPERRFVPSERPVDGLGLTEAAFVHDLFERMAAGSTTYAECDRLNALGVPPVKRYANGVEKRIAVRGWRPNRLVEMLRNPLYRGELTIHKRDGSTVTGPVPPIVSDVLWQRVQHRLEANRRRRGNTVFLLSGILLCGACGRHMQGTTKTTGSRRFRYYGCSGKDKFNRGTDEPPCPSPYLRVDDVDRAVWGEVKARFENPEAVREDLAEWLQDQRGAVAQVEMEQQALTRRLVDKDAEKGRITVLFRQGLISLTDLRGHFTELDRELEQIRAQLARFRTTRHLASEVEERVRKVDDALRRGAADLERIEREDDVAAKRECVRHWVVEAIGPAERGDRMQLRVVWSLDGGEDLSVESPTLRRTELYPLTKVGA